MIYTINIIYIHIINHKSDTTENHPESERDKDWIPDFSLIQSTKVRFRLDISICFFLIKTQVRNKDAILAWFALVSLFDGIYTSVG